MFFRPMYSDVLQGSFANNKAVALLSGGLDSALAIHLIKSQGIDVTAIHFTSFFSPGNQEKENSPVRRLAAQLDVPLVFLTKGQDFLELIRNPRYGHGKNINPCIDCRIYTLIKAKEFMEQIGASFIVTGEVVGQRPMSQRMNTIRLIEKRAGCNGIVVRPLSGKLLPITKPEEAGIVNRESLLDIAGRGRKVQLSLASQLNLSGYSPPAGGCLLTEPIFSRRVRDLLFDQQNISSEDLQLLHYGRHIKIRPGLKIIVGRNERENDALIKIGQEKIKFSPINFPGPVVLAAGAPTAEEDVFIGSILRRYVKESARGEMICVEDPRSGTKKIRVLEVADKKWISDHMI